MIAAVNTPEIWTGWMKLLSPKIRPPSGLAKRLMNYNLGQGTRQPRRSLWGQQRFLLALYWGLTSLSASFPGKGRAMQEHYQEQSPPSFPMPLSILQVASQEPKWQDCVSRENKCQDENFKLDHCPPAGNEDQSLMTGRAQIVPGTW